MQTWVRTLIALVLALTSLSATSERVREQGVTDTEIRIGNVMPIAGVWRSSERLEKPKQHILR